MTLSLLRGVAQEGLRLRLVDAKGQVVGRLASQIAQILMGKDKPTYCPWKDEGDVVVVVNASHVEFTGRKWDDKLYRWHSGWPGGLKERTAKDQASRKPDWVLRQAVLGMLPKNNLRKEMARKLRIFAGEAHDFEGDPRLAPFTMPPRNLRRKGEPLVLPPGFVPMNPEAYHRRYGHQLERLAAEQAAQEAAAAGQEGQRGGGGGGGSGGE